MISAILSRIVVLVFGTLYPAYASYKTVKTKNVRAYVKWMMYWIVYALYTFIEVFTDIFVAFWFPFYYELKILFVLWLVCPGTKGSTYIFRKIINPKLSQHEAVLDSQIDSLWNHGYNVIRNLGVQGVDYLGHLVVEFLRKGGITAFNLLPNIEGITPSDSGTYHTQENVTSPNNLEDIAIDDNEFDLLMVENPEVYKDSQPYFQMDNESDSSSASEHPVSMKQRPLKLKSKAKDPSLRERKKKNVN